MDIGQQTPNVTLSRNPEDMPKSENPDAPSWIRGVSGKEMGE